MAILKPAPSSEYSSIALSRFAATSESTRPSFSSK